MKNFETYFLNLTRRNWGAPYHFIIVLMVTMLYIKILDVGSMESTAMQLFTIGLFLFALGYELYQMKFKFQTLRGAVEDMGFNIAGYVFAILPLVGSPASAEGLAFATLPLLLMNTRTENPGVSLICIDAGHGGIKAGAERNGVTEKSITLKMARFLETHLQDLGIDSLLTRTTDDTLGLSDRAQIANESNCDLFVSLHCNASPAPQPRGVQSYFYSASGRTVEDHLQPALESVYPDETKWNKVVFGNFQVLRDTAMPAVLLEVGFLSNPKDLDLLQDEAWLSRSMLVVAINIREVFYGS